MNPLTQIKNTQKATMREIESGMGESASWHDVLAALWRLEQFKQEFARAEAAANAEVPEVDDEELPPKKKKAREKK